jgi:DNA-binding MarR family transcriptional regulator
VGGSDHPSHHARPDALRQVTGIFHAPVFHVDAGILQEARLEITAAAASQAVEKLVQGGFLDRAEDPSDRRAKQVTLSAKGSELIEKSIAERFRWVDKMVETLNADERGKVAETLKILTEKTKEIEK